ncbi:acetyl-CoA carboxylase biotin carboxyl carrier protein [Candidatus Haliotispira prima]|uniref:Biotin carboxyl carrier protein of acetyl-CoA carboxylase n=1 Tax=Candidatus Haliotispira prima TaxID=3034016 RepID=A0ABY8MHE5_9SPIO|nr:acetyl-CoA carboxylase biotin carboxyl carrier protein [Candidatus Haliotispira prima]
MDKEFLYDLMAEFEKRDIQELSFETEQGSVHLLKAGAVAREAAGSSAAVPVAATSETVVSVAGAGETVAGAGGELVKAPIVGNFYRQPAPDAPYFVNEGDRVSKGQTICILEAMKLMNELEAEFDCEIVKVLVDNGTMVQFDTPLFEVKRV